MTGTMVERPADLEALCREIVRCPAIALDTEFVRTRTFYPRIGLVQIADRERAWLIDPIAITDLSPLAAVFTSASVVKVIYSCSEDLEVLYHSTGVVPRPVFDLQIASAFAGHDYAGGYQGLIKNLLGIDLPKHSTRTDWTKRPLTSHQCEYAVEDVCHLLLVYDMMRGKLSTAGRLAWAEEALAQLGDLARIDPDPGEYYLKLRQAASMNRKQLSALQRLCVWREHEARRRDRPRSFVVEDGTLAAIARHPPSDVAGLHRFPELHPGEIRRSGQAIMAVLHECAHLPEESYPPSLGHRRQTPAYQDRMKALRKVVLERSVALGIPADLVAPRKCLEELLFALARHEEVTLPEGLRGWRQDVIGKDLLAVAQALAARPGTSPQRPA